MGKKFECEKLCRIDAGSQDLHFYLEASDTCLYMGDYLSRQKYDCSPMNNLISNLKRPLNYAPNVLEHKTGAIDTVAEIMNRLVRDTKEFKDSVFVPAPPSAEKNDPMYDNRLIQILQMANIEYREMVIRKASRPAQHSSDEKRLPPKEHSKEYFVDTSTLTPCPSRIFIFDDILTTGSTFKAIQIVLRHHFPDIPINGFFVARRVPPNSGEAFGFECQ